jgi:hypothetical protein
VRARRAALLAAVALAAAPASAVAEDVTGPELRDLASRAASDPAALQRLRLVDRVDGHPADVAGSLERAVGRDLEARLRALAAAPAGSADPGAARADAKDILAERRFRRTQVEGPFRGLLRRIGRLADPIREFLSRADGVIPGPRGVLWAILALVAGGLAWLIASRTARRRAALSLTTGRRAGSRAASPAELEREAAEAERRGEHERALRLRFRAGLLRLDERGAIELRPSLPTGEVSRRLGSEDFDRLAADFDAVVYGRRPASAGDVEAAREGWEAVLR